MASRKDDIVLVSVKLPSEIKSRLNKLGELKQRSPHWLMKEAIEHYLNEEELAEKIKKKTLSRWKEAEKDQVVANADVIAWLETWGNTEEQARPECR